jgi:hypothetical protein
MQFLNLFKRFQVTILLQEQVHVIEFLWLNVIEECPEFFGVVLYRGASE